MGGADGRMPHELLDGECYSGDLYRGYRISELDEPLQFVYTELERSTFKAYELEVVDCVTLHNRLKKI